MTRIEQMTRMSLRVAHRVTLRAVGEAISMRLLRHFVPRNDILFTHSYNSGDSC
jgi:hypothetical protein